MMNIISQILTAVAKSKKSKGFIGAPKMNDVKKK